MSDYLTRMVERLAGEVARLRETNAALAARLEAHADHERRLREKAKQWAESLRGEGYESFAVEIEEAFR